MEQRTNRGQTNHEDARPRLWSIALGMAWVLTALGAVGCGGDDSDDSDDGESKKPDTGYGAGLPVPNPRTCNDLCARLGDCAAQLCNEDTRSTRYDGLEGILAADCENSCTDSLVNSAFTDDQWQCLFQSSCREVFDYDDCRADGSYFCT